MKLSHLDQMPSFGRSRCLRLRRGAQRGRANQVVCQNVKQNHCPDLWSASDTELLEATVSRNRVDALGCRRALAVDPLGFVGCHAHAPGGHRRAVIPARRMRVAPVGLRGHDRGVNRRAPLRLAHLRNVLLLHESAVDQHRVGRFSVPLVMLLDHRGHLPLITTRVAHVDARDDLRGRVTRQLNVVRRPIAAVAHLHHSGLRIGRRRSRLRAILRLLARFDSRQLLQGLGDPLGPLPCSTLAGRLLSAAGRAGVGVQFGLERFDLVFRLFQTVFERFAASERRGPRTGPVPLADAPGLTARDMGVVVVFLIVGRW